MRRFLAIIIFVILIGPPIQAKYTARRKVKGIMTWYSREDNDSNVGSKDNVLRVFKSVATVPHSGVPHGTRLFIPALRGFPMSRTQRHDGWVRVEDVCIGSACKFLDLYVGSNKQRDSYRSWMKKRHKKHDPDVFPVIAYI